MYSRGPSIANIFQKAVLLTDTKCNKIMQRQFCSESLIKFSKIVKLKPMKRYYSGVSNIRNPNPKNRSVQGVGYIRKSFPKIPREIVQQQPLPMNEQMATCYVPSRQRMESISLGVPFNDQSFNQITPKISGKITIVLDTKEICACSNPKENIEIYVTTRPETMPTMRPVEADASSGMKCNCCQQCQLIRNPGIQSMCSESPIETPSNNMINSTNQLPIRHQSVSGSAFPKPEQSVYGLSKQRFSVLDDGRPFNQTKSRSISDYPAMRNLILPNAVNQTQLQARQMHSPPINRTHSLSRLNPSGRFNNNHPSTFQRTMGSNIVQMRRSFSFHSHHGQNSQHGAPKIDSLHQHGQTNHHGAPTVDPLRVQQTLRSGIVPPIPDHHTKSLPADIFKTDQHRRTMNALRKPDKKYSSFPPRTASVISENIPVNKPDANRSNQPRDKVEIGRSRPKVNQPVPNRIVERVITPATFSPVGHVIRNYAGGIASTLNQIAVNQRTKSLPGPITARAPLTNTSKSFNLHQQSISKNRLPAARVSAPRALIIQNQNRSDGARQADNVSRIISRFGLRQTPTASATGPTGNARQANILSTNRLSSQQFSLPPKQMSTESMLQRGDLINRSRQPQLMMPKNRSEMRQSFNHNHQIKERLPRNVSYRQQSNSDRGRSAPMGAYQINHMIKTKQPPLVLLKRPVPMRENHMNIMDQSKQPPQFLLKRPAPMRANRTNIMDQPNQPPSFLLKKRSPSIQRNRQPLQTHRRSFIPVLQRGSQYLPQKERTQSIPNYRNRAKPSHTMIPVRSRISQPKTPSFRIMPIQPFKAIKKQQRPRQNAGRRVKRDQLQSSLPAVVSNGTNQIEKPKPVKVVGRPIPYQRRINHLRFQQMPTQPEAAVPMPQERVIQTGVQEPISLKSPESANESVDKSIIKAKNPAVLFYAPGKLQLVDLPVPRLTEETGVIVQMLYVHLTDTDAQMLFAEQEGPYKLSQPTIAGKSGSGVVIDAGKKVENVKVGDKVSVKGRSCGKCTACQNDNEAICERVPINEKLGILKRFHAVPAEFVTKLPDSVHLIDGAMMDELSSAIRACKKSTVTAGDNVLVLGGKSLGLWTALAAKSMGATNVCLADSKPLVLDQANKLGIERVFLIDAKSPIPNIINGIAKYMEGENPRIVFDCNGSSLTNYIAINTSVIGGKVVFMKNAVSNQPMFLANAVDRGVDILSSQHGNTESERAALQFLSSGKVQLKGIDSSFFNITSVREAFNLLNSGTTANIFIQPSRPDDESDAKK